MQVLNREALNYFDFFILTSSYSVPVCPLEGAVHTEEKDDSEVVNYKLKTYM